MIAAITRIQLKNLSKLPRFFYYTSLINKQLKVSGGLISSKTTKGRGLEFWTLSTWESSDSMLNFVRSGAHLKGMKKIGKIGRSAESMHWETESAPDWEEARKKLLSKR